MPLLNGRKGGINTFFRRETFFLFSCWSCSRRLRGEIGRAEDPFLPSMEGKKLAEAGPPGKRPAEAKAGNCIGMYKKHFINILRAGPYVKDRLSVCGLNPVFRIISL
jgi:hypothetical protein